MKYPITRIEMLDGPDKFGKYRIAKYFVTEENGIKDTKEQVEYLDVSIHEIPTAFKIVDKRILMHKKFGKIDIKVEKVEKKVDSLNKKVTKIGDQIEKIVDQVDKIAEVK
jgi:archaellum component FlaC